MTDDLKDLLDRATEWYEPPRIGPEEIARRHDRRQRSGRVATIVVAFAVFAIASVLVWRGTVGDGSMPATPIGSDALDVPPRGDAVAAFLGDGRPVFVVHYGDGTVSVLGAFSPYRPFGIRELVAWCPSGHLVGWPDASYFDKYGVWRGGTPAPPGLAVFSFDVVKRDATGDPATLHIVGIGPSVAGHQNLSSRRTYPSTCRSRSGSPAELVEHGLDPSRVSTSPREMVDGASGYGWSGWTAVEGFLSVSPDGAVELCSGAPRSECDDGAPVEGIDAALLRQEISTHPDSPFAGTNVWLARVAHEAIVDLAISHAQ
jgi:hypothetical protein